MSLVRTQHRVLSWGLDENPIFFKKKLVLKNAIVSKKLNRKGGRYEKVLSRNKESTKVKNKNVTIKDSGKDDGRLVGDEFEGGWMR